MTVRLASRVNGGGSGGPSGGPASARADRQHRPVAQLRPSPPAAPRRRGAPPAAARGPDPVILRSAATKDLSAGRPGRRRGHLAQNQSMQDQEVFRPPRTASRSGPLRGNWRRKGFTTERPSPLPVIPAEAGIQDARGTSALATLDSRLRGNDSGRGYYIRLHERLSLPVSWRGGVYMADRTMHRDPGWRPLHTEPRAVARGRTHRAEVLRSAQDDGVTRRRVAATPSP
jgi:hypothetical protein